MVGVAGVHGAHAAYPAEAQVAQERAQELAFLEQVGLHHLCLVTVENLKKAKVVEQQRLVQTYIVPLDFNTV